MSAPLLSVQALETAYGSSQVLFGVSLDVHEGEFVTLIGRNGMGSNLSGGEQQMLAVGRALMTNPKLLILDEATEGLAPLIRVEIWSCLARLKRSGLSLIVIDKNIGPLLRLADRHYILEKGRVVWQGDSGALRAQPDVLHSYVGV